MYATTSPTGASVSIPADVSEDHNYFTSSEMSQATGYLREYGYVVLRGLVSRSACQAAQSAVAEELSRYRGYLYRQTTSHPEVHDFNEQRFVMNPILNVQDVPSAALPRFHSSALEILTSDGVQQFLRTHFDEPGKLVQSMYFHGNTATGAHQDTYYLDAENIGTMVAGWFALEDIQPGAGRFYVYPTSHRIDVQKNGGDFDIAFNHNRYKTLIIELIDKYGLECRAPALQQGDVLFWNSKTIHGSLGTTQPQFSRSSFTAHYIPESARFLQLQSRIKATRLEPYNGMMVNYPKSLDRVSQRAVMWVETTFPKAFDLAKRLAVKALTTIPRKQPIGT